MTTAAWKALWLDGSGGEVLSFAPAIPRTGVAVLLMGFAVLLLIKNVVFAVLVPGTVAVFVPLYYLTPDPAQLWLGAFAAVGFLLVGGAILCWCVRDFAVVGGGTPAPFDPPKHLVVRGLYRYSRNPMYVGVLSVLLGWALLFQSLPLIGYGVVVAAFFHAFVVFYEEPHLQKVFGSDYAKYCAAVGRWISLRPWPRQSP